MRAKYNIFYSLMGFLIFSNFKVDFNSEILNYVKPSNIQNGKVTVDTTLKSYASIVLLNSFNLEEKADSIQANFAEKAIPIELNNKKLMALPIGHIVYPEIRLYYNSILFITFDTLKQVEYFILNMNSNGNILSSFSIYKQDFINHKHLFITEITEKKLRFILYTQNKFPKCILFNVPLMHISNRAADKSRLADNFSSEMIEINISENGKIEL